MPGFAAVSGPAPQAFSPGRGPTGCTRFDIALPQAPTGNLAYDPPILFEASPQTLFVRKTGSDNNGGSSLAVIATGADGVTGTDSTFSSASAAFDSTYLNELINIVGQGRFRIVQVINANTLKLSAAVGVAATGLTWNVGGAVQTINALLSNANEAVREGDTIWIGAGTYREAILINVAGHNGASNGTTPIAVSGDVTGANTGDTGMVQITAYLTDDKTAPLIGATLRFAAGVGQLAFTDLFVVGGALGSLGNTSGLVVAAGPPGTGNTIQEATYATNRNITWTRCAFLHSVAVGAIMKICTSFGVPFGWHFDRCLFSAMGSTLISMRWLGGPAGSGADWDADMLYQNCVFLGVGFSAAPLSGSAVIAGGFKWRNITMIGGDIQFSGALSTNILSSFNNSILASTGLGLSVPNPNSLTEDYNVIIATTPRNNVAAGAHSIADGSYAPLLHFGQELIWGALLRKFGEPMAGSPLAGFGNDGLQTIYDLFAGPRPAGGGNALPAVGALERSNTFAKETGTVHTGTNAISATGPAYQDFLVPVAAGTSYTLSVFVNYDGSYTGTAPQMQILNGTEAGVADQTVTAGGSPGGGWTQITAVLFTPTANGFITVRMLSNDTSGVSEVVFDTFGSA